MRAGNRPPLRLREEAPLRYLLASPPPPASPAERRPVLCFLHGYDEGAPASIETALTQHGPLRRGSSTWEVADFVVVAPQLPARGDLWHRYADAVERIVCTVQDDHGGDPERTYLTGFSFGGNGVFDLALLQPDRWAALWAVDPTRVPTRDPGRPVWVSAGEVARRRQAGFTQAMDLQPPGSGAPPDRVYLDQGADHVGSATLAYGDPRIYRWLLARRAPARR